MEHGDTAASGRQKKMHKRLVALPSPGVKQDLLRSIASPHTLWLTMLSYCMWLRVELTLCILLCLTSIVARLIQQACRA